jgi:hypothetical protein
MNTIELGSRSSDKVIDDFDYPVIVRVPYCSIPVARDFIVEFGDRRNHGVGVQVPAS